MKNSKLSTNKVAFLLIENRCTINFVQTAQVKSCVETQNYKISCGGRKTRYNVDPNQMKKLKKEYKILSPQITAHVFLTPSLPECLMEFCKASLTFESADEIL